ncbi:MAG: glutathione S-transferase [Pelagimonas sp.]|jgi:glutathione S-transferase|nr:glutathione S-transferase [Pelagimonas sp.]
MDLLCSPASPFVRKTVVLLHETEQLDDVRQVPVTASPYGPNAALVAANPLGKIPALVRPDAPAIYDSRVICRFLDARAKAGLYPEARLWETLTLEATADAIMESAVLITYEARHRPEEKQHDDWVDGQWTKISRALDALQTRWMSHLQGPLDMGQIAVACALGYLDLRHDARNWRQGRDALSAWFAEFEQRPSMLATAPQG